MVIYALHETADTAEIRVSLGSPFPLPHLFSHNFLIRYYISRNWKQLNIHIAIQYDYTKYAKQYAY
jgi:hypothetical protein